MDKITLNGDILTSFSLENIFECGQIFRFKKLAHEKYEVITSDKKASCAKLANGDYEILCGDGQKDFFLNFFDVKTDYNSIKKIVATNELMLNAVNFGSGIRILKQNIFEMLISFIISSCNNITRIKGIINRLCLKLGEKCVFDAEEYFAFPTPEKLASKSVDFYIEQGLGYRARYVYETACRVAEGYDLEKLRELPTKEAKKELLSFLGVGGKVADCILLFGLGKTDAFPVDTWIKKVYYENFNGHENSSNKITEYFENMFGEYAGFAQQYLFYFKRELS